MTRGGDGDERTFDEYVSGLGAQEEGVAIPNDQIPLVSGRDEADAIPQANCLRGHRCQGGNSGLFCINQCTATVVAFI
jgi:hypothetical protein